MFQRDFVFTSESVSEGHPDKVADQISDAILDAHLSQDPHARVACETFVTTDFVLVGGEITSQAMVDYDAVIRSVIRNIGYTDPRLHFSADTVKIDNRIHTQSPDIAQGVIRSEDQETEIGAGDQGIMFGYAVNETESFLPMTIDLAHKLGKQLATLRKNGTLPFVRPDTKSQVSINYVNGKPTEITTILLAVQHSEEITIPKLTEAVMDEVIKKVIPASMITKNTNILVNPTGKFVIGGPYGDAGLTGRKIIVDTYGGWARHGGGAFSGKDCTKVDRSAAYMCRHIAKNIVASGLAERCELQIAYAIGVAEPLSLYLTTFGTEKIEETKIIQRVKEVYGLKPAQIIKHLKLRQPRFLQTASYGHFGREEASFTWEDTQNKHQLN